jgi:hypothetical protein
MVSEGHTPKAQGAPNLQGLVLARRDLEPEELLRRPVTLAPLALFPPSEFLHHLQCALTKYLGRDRKYGQATLFCGLSPALLVPFGICVVRGR